MRIIPLPPDRIQWLCMDDRDVYVFGACHVHTTPLAGGDKFVRLNCESPYRPARRLFPSNHWRACLEFSDRIVMASAKPVLMEVNRANKSVQCRLPVERPVGMPWTVWRDTIHSASGRLSYWEDVKRVAESDPNYQRTRMCGKPVHPFPDGHPQKAACDPYHTPLMWMGDKLSYGDEQKHYHRVGICDDEWAGVKVEAVHDGECGPRCLLRINDKTVLEQPDSRSVTSVAVSWDGLVVGALIRRMGVVLWDVD